MSHAMHVHSHPQTNRPERWYRADDSNTARADQRLELRGPRGQEYRGDKGNDGDLRQMDGSGERAARRNPLVNAMMQALQGLTAATPAEQSIRPIETTESVVAASESAPNDATATNAGAEVANTSPGSLKEAAAAFAHELFSALRGEGGERQVERHHGHDHHHFGHHHGHGWGSRGGAESAYSNLAQRLENLAAKFAPAQAGAPATSSTSSGQPGASVPPVAAPESTDAPAASDSAVAVSMPVAEPAGEPVEAQALPAEVAAGSATAPNISINVNINIQVNFTGMPASNGGAVQAPVSPLLAAFEKLLQKLQGPAIDEGDPNSVSASSDKLREFLLGIASNLKAGLGGGEPSDLRPPSGSLVNLAA